MRTQSVAILLTIKPEAKPTRVSQRLLSEPGPVPSLAPRRPDGEHTQEIEEPIAEGVPS
jgi:hypothetical protein